MLGSVRLEGRKRKTSKCVMTKKIIIRYDEAESVWVWEYLPEGEEETHDLFMDPGEQIRLSTFKELFIQVQLFARRFRVTGETFVDTGPKAPLALETEAEEGRTAPYRWVAH